VSNKLGNIVSFAESATCQIIYVKQKRTNQEKRKGKINPKEN
jgi:hypothetical protein